MDRSGKGDSALRRGTASRASCATSLVLSQPSGSFSALEITTLPRLVSDLNSGLFPAQRRMSQTDVLQTRHSANANMVVKARYSEIVPGKTRLHTSANRRIPSTSG